MQTSLLYKCFNFGAFRFINKGVIDSKTAMEQISIFSLPGAQQLVGSEKVSTMQKWYEMLYLHVQRSVAICRWETEKFDVFDGLSRLDRSPNTGLRRARCKNYFVGVCWQF